MNGVRLSIMWPHHPNMSLWVPRNLCSLQSRLASSPASCEVRLSRSSSQYAPTLNNQFTSVSALLYMTYAVIFVYFSGSLRRMETVHSRYGLAFTGMVECIASTMCSLSVCAIWGFQVNMVPRYVSDGIQTASILMALLQGYASSCDRVRRRGEYV